MSQAHVKQQKKLPNFKACQIWLFISRHKPLWLFILTGTCSGTFNIDSDLLLFNCTYPKFVKSISLKLFYDTVIFYSSIYYTETITLEYQKTKKIMYFHTWPLINFLQHIHLASNEYNTVTTEPLQNSHLGDRRKWPLWRGGHYEEVGGVIHENMRIFSREYNMFIGAYFVFTVSHNGNPVIYNNYLGRK